MDLELDYGNTGDADHACYAGGTSVGPPTRQSGGEPECGMYSTNRDSDCLVIGYQGWQGRKGAGAWSIQKELKHFFSLQKFS